MPTSGAETASSTSRGSGHAAGETPAAVSTAPATGRLVRSADYARVQGQGGRRQRGQLFLLVVAPGSGSMTRVGFAVSRKVGNAVVRNRVKRWIREGLRKVPGPRGGVWDLVLVARAEAAESSLGAVLAEMDVLFRRLDVRT